MTQVRMFTQTVHIHHLQHISGTLTIHASLFSWCHHQCNLHALPASITLILLVFKWGTFIPQTIVTVHTLRSIYVDVLGYPTVHSQLVCILYCTTSSVLNPCNRIYVLMYVPFMYLSAYVHCLNINNA